MKVLVRKISIIFIIVLLAISANAYFFIVPAQAYSDLRIATLPNDPEYFRQWYLPHIKAPEAWDYTTGSREIVVAVLDTGVDIDHPDLMNNIWINEKEKPYDRIDNDGNGYVDDFYGWNFVDNNNDVTPAVEGGELTAVHHGTIVAGVIGAEGNNLQGITGIDWRVKIMPLKVLDNLGQGNSYAVTQAINYAVKMGADVINLSFVGPDYLSDLQQAIYQAYLNDVVVVAASGNERNHGLDLDVVPGYPVCYNGSDNAIIGVAAVDQNNKILSSSNYGSNCVDVVAPGYNFYSTMVYDYRNLNYKIPYNGGWSGTSVAAPLVSGLAALIKSLNPHLKAGQIRNIIINTAHNIDVYNDKEYKGKLGNGLIDAYLALRATQATLIGAQAQSVRKEFFVFAPNSGGGPHIRIFDYQGNVLGQFFAYNPNFRGGVNVAGGDVDGDGSADIIVAPQNNMQPEIRIFDSAGNLKYKWLAYNPNFRGGVNVAVGDVDNDGQAEIITGAGASGGPHIRIFDRRGKLKSEFMAYNPNFRGGVNVAVGDIDNDGLKDVITAPYSAGGPHIRIFDISGRIKSQWFAGDERYRGGLRLAVGDLTGNGLQQLIVGAGAGQLPQARVYDWLGNVQKKIQAYNPNFRGGFSVAILKK